MDVSRLRMNDLIYGRSILEKSSVIFLMNQTPNFIQYIGDSKLRDII